MMCILFDNWRKFIYNFIKAIVLFSMLTMNMKYGTMTTFFGVWKGLSNIYLEYLKVGELS